MSASQALGGTETDTSRGERSSPSINAAPVHALRVGLFHRRVDFVLRAEMLWCPGSVMDRFAQPPEWHFAKSLFANFHVKAVARGERNGANLMYRSCFRI
ncbi:hypothetical protein [Nocardia nova]|uniref:hypothetical protein n=1 Tax=Nocardia nova TaxID=37330 RepID=UPI0033EC70EF